LPQTTKQKAAIGISVAAFAASYIPRQPLIFFKLKAGRIKSWKFAISTCKNKVYV
jgi:hypothetical protein